MTTLYAGLDVSQANTAVCVVDESGLKQFECTVATDAAAIALALKPYRRSLAKVGHETGLYTPFLHRELLRRRFPAICLDARKTRAVLAAQRNKTDRNDARDIAVALSRGFNGAAFVKSVEAHRLRALLTCRRTLKRRARDLEGVLRGMAKAFGCKYADGKLTARMRGSRVDPFVANVTASVLRARAALLTEALSLERTVKDLAQRDPICRRLMTAPGIGPITALTYRAAIDDPERFARSRDVGAHFGLTPRRWQSGQRDIAGRISRSGDLEVRAALYEAASTMLNCCKQPSALLAWGKKLQAARGLKYASTACARKLAVILHRMWVTETAFAAAPTHANVSAGAARGSRAPRSRTNLSPRRRSDA